MSRNIKEVFTILKQPITDSKVLFRVDEKKSLFWYIDYDSKHENYIKLEYMSSSQPQNVQINDILDPIDSMVGFIMHEKGVSQKVESKYQMVS